MNEELKIEPKLINEALNKAFSSWNVSNKMEAVASDVLAEVLKDCLKELAPKIKQAMKDALLADLNYMTKQFVKQLRDNY